MNIKIRKEEVEDYRTTEELAREAFWNLYFPGCHEHLIVNRIRNSNDYIKELSFVITVNGKVEGAIYYSNSCIVEPDGKQFPTITFGPVFISPNMQRKGLGRQLITYSLNQAKKLGHKAVVIMGYPYHYETYGFKGGKTYNISMEDGTYLKGLLVLPLVEGALNGVTGYPEFSEDLQVSQEEVDKFDELFDPKEKGFQESQIEFEKMCNLIET